MHTSSSERIFNLMRYTGINKYKMEMRLTEVISVFKQIKKNLGLAILKTELTQIQINRCSPCRKNNPDQTYSCPRDYGLSVIMYAHLRTPSETPRTSQHYRIERSLRGSSIGPPLFQETHVREYEFFIFFRLWIWTGNMNFSAVWVAPEKNKSTQFRTKIKHPSLAQKKKKKLTYSGRPWPGNRGPGWGNQGCAQWRWSGAGGCAPSASSPASADISPPDIPSEPVIGSPASGNCIRN